MTSPSSETKVSLLRAVEPSDANRKHLIDAFVECLNNFNAKADAPATAVVSFFFNDDGTYTVGWDTEKSSLPATAIVGMACRAVLATSTQ